MFQISPPLRGYDDLFAQYLAAIPPGSFYDDFSKPIVAWSADPTNFLLQTDQYNVPVQVTVQRIGPFHINVDTQNVVKSAMVVPQNPNTTVSVTLARGLNRLTAQEMITGGRVTTLDVIATTNTTILEPIVQEINFSYTIYQNIQNQIVSPFATVLPNQVLTIQDLLTGVEGLKVLTTKLLVRGFLHFPAREIGVQNVIEGFALNTPVFRPSRDFEPFDIERNRILRTAEIAAGEEAHVWFPNLSVTRWLAFASMADSFREDFVINSISDVEIDVTYKGEPRIQTFDFNSAGSNFLTNISLSNCFDNIDATFSIGTIVNQKWYVWSYFFDEYVTRESAIGRGRSSFDIGIPFDSGIPFDADPVDPFNDGYIGWPLAGRFEKDATSSEGAVLGLDSHVMPSSQDSGARIVYNKGAYAQQLPAHNYEIDLDAEIGIDSGEWDDTYAQGSIVGVGMTIPPGPLVAGQQYLAAAKFVDQNGMAVASGSGTIDMTEAGSEAQTIVTVPPDNNGFQWFYLTPQFASPTGSWSITSGVLIGTGGPIEVVAGPFSGFIVNQIGPQQVGVPFTVSVQACDAYQNPVQDVGINTTLQITPIIGFLPDSVSPESVTLVDGAATFQLIMTQAGTGALRFSLTPGQTDSNIFTVS